MLPDNRNALLTYTLSLQPPTTHLPIFSNGNPKKYTMPTFLSSRRKMNSAISLCTPPDPFRNGTEKMTPYEWFKVVFMTVTLVAPLRLLLVFVTLFFAWAFSLLSVVGLSKNDIRERRPRASWRQGAMEPVRFLARAMLFFCGFHWIRVEGKPKRGVPIVVANHPSIFEPFWLAYAYLPIAVSKEENERLPFLGTIMAAFSCILVRRKDADSRRQAAEEIKEVASNPDLPSVLVFPEGTNTSGRYLISFKPGAFIPGKEIQAVCIRYPYRFHDPTAGSFTSMAWHVYRTLCQFHNDMTVRCLAPRMPTELEVKDHRRFAQNVRDEMSFCLGVGTTEHSFEDALMRRFAIKLGIDPLHGMVEYGRLRSSPNRPDDISVDALKCLLSKLAGEGTSKDFVKIAYTSTDVRH